MSSGSYIAQILLLMILTQSCSRYIIYEQSPTVVHSKNLNFERDKIGIIGFYPWKEKIIGKTLMRIKYQARLDYENQSAEIQKLGRPVADIPYSGLNKNVPPANIRKFMEQFTQLTGGSGLQELKSLFERDNAGNRYFLKSRKVKYYIMGVHLPEFQTANANCLSAAGPLMTILSLGLFPLYEKKNQATIISIYDHDLKLIKNLVYRNNYLILSSWWMPPWPKFETIFNSRATPPPEVWGPDVKAFVRNAGRFLH